MSISRHPLSRGISWSGLAIGPAAWAFSTQANYAFVAWGCSYHFNFVPLLGLSLAIVSFLSAFLSWRAWQRYDQPGPQIPEQDGHPRYLVAGIGTYTGVLFGLVIIMQAVAGLIVDPCLR
jgi:hypothetical protein